MWPEEKENTLKFTECVTSIWILENIESSPERNKNIQATNLDHIKKKCYLKYI
jgi:hypothetical protein